MDIDSTISAIRRQRQAFAYGIEGVHTLFNAGIEAGDPLRPLRTQIVEDQVRSTWFLPQRMEMNTHLEQSTTNQLAMQLVVGTGDAVSTYDPEWADHDSPTIRFLRLVRNGVAHGNKIVLTAADPRPNTVWRGFEITRDMESDPLFTQPAKYIYQTEDVEMIDGHMEAGDALVLTTDVLELLIDESDAYTESNIIELPKNGWPDWDEPE
jgi:hypothetical protein